MKSVIIIGAGASGMIASILIKRNNPDFNVTILEKLDRVGKKILATGNGKCNFANLDLDKKYYNNQEFMAKYIDNSTVQNIRDFYMSIGVVSKEISSGRLYPYTEKASTVLDAFRMAIEQLKINVVTSCIASSIKRNNDGYIIKTNMGTYECDYVIYACGASSGENLGTDGSSFKMLEDLNINITKLHPGLVGLKTNEKYIKSLDGCRAKAKLLLYKDDNSLYYCEEGEIQFKKDGISGIVVMNIASIINRTSKPLNLRIDFCPEYNDLEELENLISNSPLHLESIVSKNISKVILDKSKNYEEAVKLLKAFPFNFTSTYGFVHSQVTVGGINLSEINECLELNKYPNMYVIGEALDIDGVCGGYNLSFAYISSNVVSNHIGKKTC